MHASLSDDSSGAKADVDGTAKSSPESLDVSISELSGRLKKTFNASSAVRPRFPKRINEYSLLEHERHPNEVRACLLSLTNSNVPADFQTQNYI